MGTRDARPGSHVLAWLSVLLIVFGSLSWLPAAAQDGTPEAPVTTAPEPTAPPAPTDPPAPMPTDPPPPVLPTDEPAADLPAASQAQVTTLAAPQVTGITLDCPVADVSVPGVVTVSDPQPATITLQLRTTVGTASVAIDDVTIDLVSGQATYQVEADLEPSDFTTSTSKEVVVTGPDGTPVSNAIGIAQAAGGGTVCVPPGTPAPTEPVPTAVATGTQAATHSPTATQVPTGSATVAVTATPAPSVGRVSNTGGSNLRCRTQPNTSSGIITLVPAGSTLEVRAPAANGWVPVTCAGQAGWVSADYLVVTTAPAPTATATVTPTPGTTPAPGTATWGTVSNTGGSNLRCRTAPNTDASIVTLLPAGQRVETRGAAVNGWLPVRCGGQEGWVSASYITLSPGSGTATPPATTTPSTPTTPAPGGVKTATVSGTGGAGLRCRTAPVSGPVITVMPELARVETVGSQQNGWIQVRCAGQVGWASVTYLLFNAGTGSGAGEIWMDINLSTQYMVVYQGSNVIGRTYVSTGRPGFDTPTGTYYINRKVPVKDMTGTLGGEYYYVHDVPHVMYFTNRGHAIHGAYWHNNFGYRMSHGCVNLPLNFASWLYSITPMGARVRIHY